VVFSRETAMEIVRRSEVLLPIMDPNWKILTRLRESAAAKREISPAVRPLVTENLLQVCRDPALGFVISPQTVGLESLRQHAGARKDWSLYDCRRLGSSVPHR
jgi:hypothetical protein